MDSPDIRSRARRLDLPLDDQKQMLVHLAHAKEDVALVQPDLLGDGGQVGQSLDSGALGLLELRQEREPLDRGEGFVGEIERLARGSRARSVGHALVEHRRHLSLDAGTLP
jgi:hypothetical protein